MFNDKYLLANTLAVRSLGLPVVSRPRRVQSIVIGAPSGEPTEEGSIHSFALAPKRRPLLMTNRGIRADQWVSGPCTGQTSGSFLDRVVEFSQSLGKTQGGLSQGVKFFKVFL